MVVVRCDFNGCFADFISCLEESAASSSSPKKKHKHKHKKHKKKDRRDHADHDDHGHRRERKEKDKEEKKGGLKLKIKLGGQTVTTTEYVHQISDQFSVRPKTVLLKLIH